MTRPRISVVVPCYGCESCLEPLYDTLRPVLEAISPAFELVMVDDHSPQRDWEVIARLAAKDPRVRGVKLTRNFGQHSAIAAGLSVAEGDWVVVMDCDLQDKPVEVQRLYDKAMEGWDVVFGRRVTRADGAKKVMTSKVFHYFNAKFSGKESISEIGTFSIISRRVVLEMRQFRESRRNYGIQLNWLGFPITDIAVEHQARHAGKSTYSLRKQLAHGVATVLSQSTRPLHASIAFGFLAAAGAVFATLYLVIRKLTGGIGVEGWTGVMVSLWFLFGILFVNLGVIGLYLGSVFDEVKNRPPFVVERTTFEDHSTGATRISGERGA
jgi:polyisoprenyl-phosphate glycosyltransferase